MLTFCFLHIVVFFSVSKQIYLWCVNDNNDALILEVISFFYVFKCNLFNTFNLTLRNELRLNENDSCSNYCFFFLLTEQVFRAERRSAAIAWTEIERAGSPRTPHWRYKKVEMDTVGNHSCRSSFLVFGILTIQRFENEILKGDVLEPPRGVFHLFIMLTLTCHR